MVIASQRSGLTEEMSKVTSYGKMGRDENDCVVMTDLSFNCVIKFKLQPSLLLDESNVKLIVTIEVCCIQQMAIFTS